MSFSHSVKQEILENKAMRLRCKQAQAYGLFLFGRVFRSDQVCLHTENAEVARLFQWFARDLLGKDTAFSTGELRRSGRTVSTVALAGPEDCRRLTHMLGMPGNEQGGTDWELGFSSQEQLGAFLAGAFLACGNVTDPEKGYHLEFVVREQALCHALTALLDEAIPGARVSARRQNQIVYYKECASIEDLMTLMGATKSCLAIIDVETFKSVRNQANRTTNCETANIDKLVGAAASQLEDIRLLLEEVGEGEIPAPLLQVARLRMDNPEASLRELAELSPEPITRSGIHHRLDKLSRMAAALRAGRQEK